MNQNLTTNLTEHIGNVRRRSHDIDKLQMQLGWKTYVPKIYLKLASFLLTHTPVVPFERISAAVTQEVPSWNFSARILHMSEVFCCFLQSFPGRCPDNTPNWATVVSFLILPNSLFTNHPTI